MKYEYKVISLKRNIGEKSYEQFAVEQILDKEGGDGWELVTVDNGIAYFKRPIQDADDKGELVGMSYKDWLNSQ